MMWAAARLQYSGAKRPRPPSPGMGLPPPGPRPSPCAATCCNSSSREAIAVVYSTEAASKLFSPTKLCRNSFHYGVVFSCCCFQRIHVPHSVIDVITVRVGLCDGKATTTTGGGRGRGREGGVKQQPKQEARAWASIYMRHAQCARENTTRKNKRWRKYLYEA